MDRDKAVNAGGLTASCDSPPEAQKNETGSEQYRFISLGVQLSV